MVGCEEKKRMKELDKEKIFWIVNVFILFLYAVDLFGFRNKYAIVWIVIAGLYCIVMKTAVKLDIKAILLSNIIIQNGVSL